MESTDRSMQEQVNQMEAQLADLYRDREALHDALGVSSAEDVLRLVRSLEEQLTTFYADQEKDA